jgi:prepilin-type N-terminal cleavage/methylation domain-containing protein
MFMFTNQPPSESQHPRRLRSQVTNLCHFPGFTLMEVVIALTILGMITGTLFSIIQGSVKGAAQIEQIQRENDAINRFLDLCRKTFTTLPSTATLELALLDPNSPGSGQELTISGSPNCFGFGINPISYQDTILGLRPDPNGATDTNNALISYLCLSREDLIPQTDANGMAQRQETTGLSAPDAEGRYWMPLLPDVVNLKWRFFKDADDTWLEEWSDDAWPDLIEVQLVMRDRTTPLRMVYSVPTILLVKGNGTTSTNTSSSQGGNNNGGGGGQGGGGQGGGGQGGGGQGGGGQPGGGPGGGGPGGGGPGGGGPGGGGPGGGGPGGPGPGSP